ncbi:hypothetical protein KP509_36G051900 [Ceratopteris richardii]|uniref:Pentatricopeptide repeat-containing protein n=1 Tax=Ceratopteris richardii TaxID=49495 RepID=A0A8T2QCV0_CERRI|nr:hypothetical protein KP509_36G051900 [Ceratopteris richardii]
MGLLSSPSRSPLIKLLSSEDQFLSFESFASLLRHYRKSKLSIEDAKAVFLRLHKRDIYSWHILMKAYGQNGLVDDAYALFSQMPSRDHVSWNTMIAAFAQNGHGRQALELFHQMQRTKIKPNTSTLVSVLDACAELADLDEGLQVHSLLDVERKGMDVVLGTALITMYGKCGVVKEAKTVFDGIVNHDVKSWTAIISAFSQNGHETEAMEHFIQMHHKGFKADRASFLCAIDACGGLESLEDGRMVHAFIVEAGYEHDSDIGNALVDMYGRCKHLRDARETFNQISSRDIVSWTAIIGACAKNAKGAEGLRWYNQMKTEGIIPNRVTFLCALDVCAVTTGIRAGREVHTIIHYFGLQDDAMVGNALVNMYSKCGGISDAKFVFNSSHKRDVVSYTLMIAILSKTGHIKDAFSLLKQMENEGIKPNDVTFVCTLNACSHAGQIDAAREFFYSLNQEYGLAYRTDHYVCMIDLLGNAGHLDEAEKLIAHIPAEQAGVAWLCLLSACKIHGDTERAARATSFCHELDLNDFTAYVSLANLISSSKVRALKGASKVRALKGVNQKHDGSTPYWPNCHSVESSPEYSFPNLRRMGDFLTDAAGVNQKYDGSRHYWPNCYSGESSSDSSFPSLQRMGDFLTDFDTTAVTSN